MSNPKILAIASLSFVLMIAISFGAAITVTNSTEAHQGIVSFDTSKYGNARRQVASRIMFSESEEVKQQSVSVIARVDRQARAVIEDKAAGRLIVLTQALAITDQVEDITDEVLDELGLPTDAPTITVDPTEGPSTNYGSSALYKTAKDNLMGRNNAARQWEKDEKRALEKAETEKWVP